MWAMAQYARLAIDISAGKDTDTPAVVTQCVQHGSCPVTGSVLQTVNVTVPDPDGIAMTRVSATQWTTTIDARADTTLSYKYDLGGSWASVEKGPPAPTSQTGA